MKLKYKYITLTIMLLLLTSCATVNTQLVDPAGRIFPMPSYSANISGTNMTVFFNFATIKKEVDLDGSEVLIPTYLNYRKHQKLSLDKYEGLILTIEVNNPDGLEYSLDQRMIITHTKLYEIQYGGKIRKSNRPYRRFTYNLPFKEDYREIDNTVVLIIENDPVLLMGHFRYKIITNKGGDIGKG